MAGTSSWTGDSDVNWRYRLLITAFFKYELLMGQHERGTGVLHSNSNRFAGTTNRDRRAHMFTALPSSSATPNLQPSTAILHGATPL